MSATVERLRGAMVFYEAAVTAEWDDDRVTAAAFALGEAIVVASLERENPAVAAALEDANDMLARSVKREQGAGPSEERTK